MFEHKHLLNLARAARRGENLASPFIVVLPICGQRLATPGGRKNSDSN
jgi:hypothetical protein